MRHIQNTFIYRLHDYKASTLIVCSSKLSIHFKGHNDSVCNIAKLDQNPAVRKYGHLYSSEIVKHNCKK